MSLYVTLTLSLFLKLYHGLQCKGWPNSGWCSDAGYEPSLKPGLWEQAWDENGECVITKAPSTAPTLSPTLVFNRTTWVAPLTLIAVQISVHFLTVLSMNHQW